MENKTKTLAWVSLFMVVLLLISFCFFKRTKIYVETLFLQEQVNESGEIEAQAYLINQNKINISQIHYFSVEYVSGAETFGKEHLEYKNGLLHLINVNLLNLKNLTSKVTLYAQDDFVWNYLIGSL